MPTDDGKLNAIQKLRMIFLPSEELLKKRKKRKDSSKLGNPEVNRDGSMKKKEQ